MTRCLQPPWSGRNRVPKVVLSKNVPQQPGSPQVCIMMILRKSVQNWLSMEQDHMRMCDTALAVRTYHLPEKPKEKIKCSQ